MPPDIITATRPLYSHRQSPMGRYLFEVDQYPLGMNIKVDTQVRVGQVYPGPG